MIAPVALGQTRFVLPGLSADDRGVAMGRRLLCLFPDLRSTVGFLRTLSRSGALRDVLASLLVEDVRAAQGSGPREVAVGFEVQGSFSADPCAASARAHGGLVFTGTHRHHVPYRDAGRPLGTDLLDATALQPGDDGYALYQEAGVDVRLPVRRREVRELVLSLTPTALTPRELREQRPDVVVVRVPPGLSVPLQGYLWRRRVRGSAALARPLESGLFDAPTAEVTLVRCLELPPGVLAQLSGIPGVELYLPATDNVLVQRGYRHPVALDACASLFPREEVVLFAAARRAVERLAGPLRYVPLDDLVDVVMLNNPAGAPLPAPAVPTTLDINALPLRVHLVPDPWGRGEAEAVLVPTDRLADLMALAHILPAALWQGCRVCLADPFCVVLSPGGVRALPVGIALTATNPRVFVPVGLRFSPPLPDDLLAEHLGLHGNDNLVFFPPEGRGPPFALAASAFQPLARAAVHPEDLGANLEAVTLLPPVSPARDPTVAHPPRGELARWDGLATPGRGNGPKA
jgi:hypothetical protein